MTAVRPPVIFGRAHPARPGPAAIRSALVVLAVMMSSCAGPAVTPSTQATVQPAATIDEAKQANEWLSHYFERPDPSGVPAQLARLDRSGTFQKPEAMAPLSAFFALLFRANPGEVPGWAGDVTRFSESGRVVVWTALWYSKASTARGALEAAAAGERAENRRRIEGLLVRDAPEISALPINSPAVLDMLWGAFLASGDPIYVQRVITVLPDSEIPGWHGVIGLAAEWSLTGNAIQHPRVLQICEAEAARSEGATARILSGVIAKAKARSAK
jgi:hypothetical protein